MKIAKPSRLVNRNVQSLTGRTSIRLEPELWEMLEETCRREKITLRDLIQHIERTYPTEPRTSAVRTYLLSYYRDAATEKGHAAAGHGALA